MVDGWDWDVGCGPRVHILCTLGVAHTVWGHGTVMGYHDKKILKYCRVERESIRLIIDTVYPERTSFDKMEGDTKK
jgi:hypothetical protein